MNVTRHVTRQYAFVISRRRRVSTRSYKWDDINHRRWIYMFCPWPWDRVLAEPRLSSGGRRCITDDLAIRLLAGRWVGRAPLPARVALGASCPCLCLYPLLSHSISFLLSLSPRSLPRRPLPYCEHWRCWTEQGGLAAYLMDASKPITRQTAWNS